MSIRQNIHRRHFLIGSAIAVASPYIVPRAAFGANEKITTGHIGVGRQGTSNLKDLLDHAVAVCDVDKQHAANAQKLVAGKNGKCDVYGDFRKMLDRKDIDAVVVSTPDHWHALATIFSCQAGKHVYCEKPLTHGILEGRKMVEAARRNKCIVQTGSQQRSDERFRYACELVRNGRLGKLDRIEVGLARTNHPGALGPDTDPPEWLDYDLWLGPAPYRPYNEKRIHYNFRFWLDYSGGQITNWGAHNLDIAHWALGVDDSGPTEVSGTAVFDAEKRFTVPDTVDMTYLYGDGLKVHFGQKYRSDAFYGEKGSLFVSRSKLESDPEDIIKQPIGPNEIHLYKSDDHHQNWLECIRSGNLPICDVEIGHRTAAACHLAKLSAVLGRKIRWDPAKEQVIDDPEAAAMTVPHYRAPWTL